jgi:Ni/Co efflux regulator RcnB
MNDHRTRIVVLVVALSLVATTMADAQSTE